MRWLLISSQHHPSHGGIGMYIAHFCAAAVKSGWHVELITRPSNVMPPGVVAHAVTTPDASPSFEAHVSSLRKIERIRPYRYALWSLAVAEKLLELEGRFECVEFVDIQAEGYVSLASKNVQTHLRAMTNAVIVHAHTPMFVEEEVNGVDMTRFGRQIYHKWERESLAKADGVIAASKLLRDRLSMACRCEVVPYPITCSAAKSKSNQNPMTLALVGSVQPRKGVHHWVASLNRVLSEFPNANAILIGPDTPTSPTGTSMVQYVTSLLKPTVRSRFQWLGAQSHQCVQATIGAASVVVVPSTFDNSPFVVSEALCASTPVIVSDQVGWIEHVPDLPIVKAGDFDGLANAQIEVLRNPQSARERVQACRNQIRQRCAPELHLERKAEFATNVRRVPKSVSDDHEGEDAIDSIRDFISTVEKEERSVQAASSVSS